MNGHIVLENGRMKISKGEIKATNNASVSRVLIIPPAEAVSVMVVLSEVQISTKLK